MMTMTAPISSRPHALRASPWMRREAMCLAIRHVLDIAEAQISVSAFCRALGLSLEESWNLKLLIHDIADFLSSRRHDDARLLLRDISNRHAVGLELAIELAHGSCDGEESAGRARCLQALQEVVACVMSQCAIEGRRRLVARRWAKSGRCRTRLSPEELQYGPHQTGSA